MIWQSSGRHPQIPKTKTMHGETHPGITTAFDAASLRHMEYADLSGDDDRFYDLFDLIYETDNVSPDAVEAAFSQGQKFPNATRYSCWWGDAVVWFIGEPEEIIKRLESYHPPST